LANALVETRESARCRDRVASRTKEIAVRIALGTPPSAILWTVAGDVASMVAVGTALGVPIGIAATHLLAPMLFGATPVDSPSIAVADASVLATSIFAAIPPAYRAARIESTIALRHE
jgi:putative ABC transport system permease protein